MSWILYATIQLGDVGNAWVIWVLIVYNGVCTRKKIFFFFEKLVHMLVRHNDVFTYEGFMGNYDTNTKNQTYKFYEH